MPEQTAISETVAEMCLSHLVGDETVRSYFRSEMLDKRREALNQWMAYLSA